MIVFSKHYSLKKGGSMKEQKTNTSVYKNVYTTRVENEGVVSNNSNLSNVIVLILSLVLPFIGIAFCVLWSHDRPKDKFYPLIGTIINVTLYTAFFVIILLYLFLGSLAEALK